MQIYDDHNKQIDRSIGRLLKKDDERMLYPYADKLKCFQDDRKRKPRHPRDYSESWSLVDYDFMYL
ncbi:hypothetical protein CA600_06355 [Paenibacillus sp. VTT E-133280]|nr:hypothetical protein CA600_06355 [Paenibacillus sp. VTT E-133280]